VATIGATEGNAILHRVEEGDFQAFMKGSLRNAVFLIESAENYAALFAPGLTGDLFHDPWNIGGSRPGL
jgi:hypothetical protein